MQLTQAMLDETFSLNQPTTWRAVQVPRIPGWDAGKEQRLRAWELDVSNQAKRELGLNN